MKALLIAVLVLSGCATITPEKYDAGKALWEKQKVEWGCVQVAGTFDDPRPVFRDGYAHGPSMTRYTKWNCVAKKEPMYSPYEWMDSIHQVRPQ